MSKHFRVAGICNTYLNRKYFQIKATQTTRNQDNLTVTVISKSTVSKGGLTNLSINLRNREHE